MIDPSGWLVVMAHDDEGAGTFVPDPRHEWPVGRRAVKEGES